MFRLYRVQTFPKYNVALFKNRVVTSQAAKIAACNMAARKGAQTFGRKQEKFVLGFIFKVLKAERTFRKSRILNATSLQLNFYRGKNVLWVNLRVCHNRGLILGSF